MRVRVVLAVALLLVAGALALDMSGTAPRTAGSDHVTPSAFAAQIPPGGVLCEVAAPLPADATRAQILVGTYGQPVPELSLSFLTSSGKRIASGRLPRHSQQGYVTIPLRREGSGLSTRACLSSRGAATVSVGGEVGTFGAVSEQIDGRPEPGRITLIYFRPGRESWWQLLSTLAHRFGLAKASFYGDWTLPVAALLLFGVWIATVRLLLRELT